MRPKLVIIEPCNSTPLWEKDVSYDGHGASPFLIKQLAKEKGYTFLCTTGNLFFVRDDINTLEANDEIEFPWWLPDDIKRMVSHITNRIPDAHLDDFGKDIIKYTRGAKLGYMTNE